MPDGADLDYKAQFLIFNNVISPPKKIGSFIYRKLSRPVKLPENILNANPSLFET